MTNYIATTGFFDGIHRGHVKVLERLKAMGEEYQLPVCVVTFWPHPRIVLNSEPANLRLLSSVDEKRQRLEALGIHKVVIIPFTKELSLMSPDLFLTSQLIDRLNVAGLCVGYDHHIGKDRSGGFATIKKLCGNYSMPCEQVDSLRVGDKIVSSQKIREQLTAGKLHEANEMLGYPYSLKGVVVHGNKLGRTISFPTANLAASEPLKLIPAEGVYAVSVSVLPETRKYRGMLYIGKKTTVNSSGKQSIEVNIFDFDDDIYGKELNVEFEKYVRSDMKFATVEALKKQLTKDKQAVLQQVKPTFC
jgi:riboflavin kinase/FMN adenylyltransferase